MSPDSVWSRRGFLQKTRARIFNQTWEWNREQGGIVAALCATNPNLEMGQAISAYNRWTDAALGDLEGTAAYGRGEREPDVWGE